MELAMVGMKTMKEKKMQCVVLLLSEELNIVKSSYTTFLYIHYLHFVGFFETIIILLLPFHV